MTRPLIEQMAVAYTTEIDRLRAEVVRLQDALACCRELSELRREAEQKLRAALEFYGQVQSYQEEGDDGPIPVMLDAGAKARKALANEQEGK